MTTSARCAWAFEEPKLEHCWACSRLVSVYRCCGCNKVFCLEHSMQHREELRHYLRKITVEFEKLESTSWTNVDDYKATLIQSRRQMEMKIAEWQHDSIDKINRTAEGARDELHRLFELHLNTPDYSVKRTAQLKAWLHEATKTGEFYEEHLKRWETALDCLRQSLKTWQTSFARLVYTESFIQKLNIAGDTPIAWVLKEDIGDFHPFVEHVELIEAPPGPIIIDNLQTDIRQFRFKSRYVFFGIRSKSPTVYRQPELPAITYGWTADSCIYADECSGDMFRYKDSMQLDDQFLLTVNSRDRVISLTNERTHETREFAIDERRCPLPWQLNIQFLDSLKR